VKLCKRSFATLLAVIVAGWSMVMPTLPVSAASVPVTLYPTSGPPGTDVVILGNFTAGSTYTVTFGALTPVATGIVIGKGNVGSFDLPDLPRGTYSVIVTSSAGDIAALPLPTFTISPQIFLSSSIGGVADQIDINGNGFNSNQNISINFGTINIASVTSDSEGVFPSTAITIPQAPAGNHMITASDQSGSTPGVTFSISPEITLSDNEGTVGSTINMSGTGFAGSEIMSFFIDNKNISPVATTEPSGWFTNVNLVIPPITGGSHTIKVQDSSANIVTVSYLVDPSITVGPNNGPAGTKVTVIGNGFQSISNNPISIMFNGTVMTIGQSLVADGNGNFESTFIIPSSASGVGTITADDNVDTASTNFSVAAKVVKSVANVTFSALNGPVGTTVTINGTGFADGLPVAIKYDNSPAGTVTTNSAGNFTTTFTIPASGAGDHQVSISDQVSTITDTFNIVSAINVNESSGTAGDSINIDGTGFITSHIITVNFDGDLVASTTADATGTFVATFKVPASGTGNHQITVTDGTNTMTSAFSMNSTPLAVPTLFSPLPSTKASNMPTLEWQDMSNTSDLTYILEISKDATFDILVLKKPGLIATEYTLPKQEMLTSVSKNQPYYWRVMAIDSTNNQSRWSTSFTFYVGNSVPTWIYYAASVALVLIVGVISLLIERRRIH